MEKLRRRWQIIPSWVKALPVAAMLLVLSVLHVGAPHYTNHLATGVHRLFFVPLFLASLLYGLKGGLVCAALISLNNLPLFFSSQPLGATALLNLVMEVALYFVAGAITGFFVDREKREARKLKEAEDLALLGRAAAAVAHELKTPLVAIGGFALQLQRELPPDHPHHRKLGIIVEQVAHMERLLREMLDYSRPLELALREQTLEALVSEVVSLCRPLAREAGVGLEWDVSPPDCRSLLDGARMKQVLLNLVQNAVQASPRGTRVTVVARRDGDQVLVSVSDRGCGIPPAQRDKIFSPFFTTKTGGTGLGLSVSQKIVSAHGGRLELARSDDKGSTFVVYLPLHGPPPRV